MTQVTEKTEVLTMEEALVKGYTHFVTEQGERIIKFSSVKDEDRQNYKNEKCFLVDMESPLHYTIGAETIKGLIMDYVDNQEDVTDEDGKLCDIVEEQDYSKLAEELNLKFEKHKYYETLDIQVIIGCYPF